MKTPDVDFFSLFRMSYSLKLTGFPFMPATLPKPLNDTEYVVTPQEKTMILTMIDRFSYKSLSNFILQYLVE